MRLAPRMLEIRHDVGDHGLTPVPFLALDTPKEILLEAPGVRLDAAGLDPTGPAEVKHRLR